jgi:hypothetical protein
MKYLWSLALVSTLALSACGGGSPLTLTQENFNKVQNDMSQADVKQILGEPTRQESKDIPIVGGTETDFYYTNPGNGSEVTIVFKNDKVQDKKGTINP